ncbi:XK-related protein 4-like [Branchiostoma floridae x Branchiostoma belcheri]
MSWHDDDSSPKGLKCLLAVLQLSVVSGYLNILYLLVRGKDVEERVSRELPSIHLFEAMLESVPQLCLQLYILLLTGEQVSVLKVITMVASLLAAVKAVFTCFYYHGTKESNRTCSRGFVTRVILFILWKVVELSVRVLAIGLFASAFKPWIALPIGVHWLVMTLTDICVDEGARDCLDMMLATLFMAVDTFSITYSTDHKQTFWLNSVLTLLGNITMVTVWYTLKAGQNWYDVPALVGVLWGSLVSAGYGIIDMLILEDEKSQDEEDSPDPEPGTSTELDTV